MHWAAKYVGVPYTIGGDELSGADCWGLVRLVLRAERRIEMPALAIGQAGNDSALRRCFSGWSAADMRRLHEFDIVTMRNPFGHHVGIVAMADDFGAMILHCDEPASSVIRLSMMKICGYKDFRAWRYNANR